MTDADLPETPRRVAERIADDSEHPPEEFTEAIHELREYSVPFGEIERSIRAKYGLQREKEAIKWETVVDTLGDLAPDDALGVRSTEGYVVTGRVANIADADVLEPGDGAVSISDPTVWNVTGDVVEPVELDHGPPKSYRYDDNRGRGSPEDWDGPSVSIGVGLDEYRGDLVLTLRTPLWDSRGVNYYGPHHVGPIVAVTTGDLVDPRTLLNPNEDPPNAHGGFL